MSRNDDFSAIFERLKRIYEPAAASAVVAADTREKYLLNTPFSTKYNKELFLGGVQIEKNYVSFYIMPVYIYPELLEGISPELKKRMQGKSCFNFKKLDEGLFKELEELLKEGVNKFHQEGLI